jgi:hypothetical protein
MTGGIVRGVAEGVDRQEPAQDGPAPQHPARGRASPGPDGGQRPPSRWWRLLTSRWLRGRRGEGLAVAAGSVALALLTNKGSLADLTTTAPGNLGDPLYFAWQLAWVWHALTTDPGGLWTTNAFLQAPDNLAFTDTMLGWAPLGAFAPSGQAGALAMLNVAGLLATSIATAGGYALGRALGAGRIGSAVLAAGFGYAPWRLEQVIHLNILSTGGIALSLALLARGNGWSMRSGWRPERMSPGFVAAGWAVACWQLTFGFATGIWFVYGLLVPMLAWSAGWLLTGRRRAGLPRGVLIAHGAGGLAFVVVGGLLLRPYLRVIDAHPEARRGPEWLPLFSPPWRGLLTAPDTSWFWGDRQLTWRAGLTWQPEMVLSPGLVLIALAVVGVFFSVWPWRRRLGVLLTTAVLVVLAMGTAFPGQGRWTYLPLFHHAPGWSALRTPGRLIIWVTLGLGVLAAGAVARFYAELRPAGRLRPGLGRRAVLAAGAAAAVGLLPAAVVVGEGLNKVPHWQVATSPVTLTSLRAPIMILPSDEVGDYHLMLWSTEGWPVLANGNSGFDPLAQVELRQQALTFPDAASVAYLRGRGVLTVVIVRSRAAGGPWQGAADRPVTGLALRRTDLGDAVVYDLTSP